MFINIGVIVFKKNIAFKGKILKAAAAVKSHRQTRKCVNYIIIPAIRNKHILTITYENMFPRNYIINQKNVKYL